MSMENNYRRLDKKALLEDILKYCYWDYSISIEELENILNSKDVRLKKKVFDKIVKNYRDPVGALNTLFSSQDLEKLFDEYPIKNSKIMVLRNVLLKEHNYIKELTWKKR